MSIVPIPIEDTPFLWWQRYAKDLADDVVKLGGKPHTLLCGPLAYKLLTRNNIYLSQPLSYYGLKVLELRDKNPTYLAVEYTKHTEIFPEEK